MRAVATPRPTRAVWPRISLRSFLERLIAADANHRAAVHLARLDERMLRDIGLTRDEVRRPDWQ